MHVQYVCSEMVQFNLHVRFMYFSICSHVALQACLKAIYVTWLSSGQPSGHAIEPLVANLLSSVTVPLVNCPPVRRPLGLLKELIVHPIDEASSLPYSSTCTIALLKSIGMFPSFLKKNNLFLRKHLHWNAKLYCIRVHVHVLIPFAHRSAQPDEHSGSSAK